LSLALKRGCKPEHQKIPSGNIVSGVFDHQDYPTGLIVCVLFAPTPCFGLWGAMSEKQMFSVIPPSNRQMAPHCMNVGVPPTDRGRGIAKNDKETFELTAS
jgi:hypothetical protein